MQRRQLIALILGTALGEPVASLAQTPATVPCIAVLSSRSPDALQRYLDALGAALVKIGLVRKRDYMIAVRSTGGDATRIGQAVAEVIALRPAVIVTNDTPLTLAAKRATKEIPIVGVLIADPVGFGLVASLAHPGGNVTGLLSSVDKLVIKDVELLHQIAPSAKRIGVVFNAANPANAAGVPFLQANSAALAVNFLPAAVRTAADIDGAFRLFTREYADAVFVFQDALFSANQKRIAELALAARLPTVFGFREFVEAGGLMSYGLNVVAQWQRAAAFVDKILKGAKPADLPVELQPKLELVINATTAKALGLTIPPSVLAFADDVID
jgi:putative tryptophan/tyrosine transport system substrate-binding protein